MKDHNSQDAMKVGDVLDCTATNEITGEVLNIHAVVTEIKNGIVYVSLKNNLPD